MRLLPAVLTTALPWIMAGAAQAHQPETILQDGSYEVTYRLELPHVEEWALDRTTTICLPKARAASAAPLSVLSGNNPLATCPTRNFVHLGATLRFDIV